MGNKRKNRNKGQASPSLVDTTTPATTSSSDSKEKLDLDIRKEIFESFRNEVECQTCGELPSEQTNEFEKTLQLSISDGFMFEKFKDVNVKDCAILGGMKWTIFAFCGYSTSGGKDSIFYYLKCDKLGMDFAMFMLEAPSSKMKKTTTSHW